MSISLHPRALESIKVWKLMSEKRMLMQDPRHPSPVVADAPVFAGSLTTDRPSSCPHPGRSSGGKRPSSTSRQVPRSPPKISLASIHSDESSQMCHDNQWGAQKSQSQKTWYTGVQSKIDAGVLIGS